MSEQTIMIIRHGEKASDPEPYRGVDDHGNHDPHSLTVKGWQRAGALPCLFGGHLRLRRKGIAVPTALFACAVSPSHPSKRCEQTLGPLALLLGEQVRTGYSKGDEEALAAQVMNMHDDVLICWEHKMIPRLARMFAGRSARIPDEWPENRFDLVWVIRNAGGKAALIEQIPQLLLAGDICEPIASG
jgi:broad specificity phosphatase PhoE